MLTIELAGVAVGINHKYPYIRNLSADYLTDSAPDFTVALTDDDIVLERKNYSALFPDDLNPPEPMIEANGIYRKIAEEMINYNAVVFHGASLLVDGEVYIFTARSGVGKTTHIRLWLDKFENVRVLNGDKPILRVIDGRAYVSGTPWRGKEGYGEPGLYPLAGVAFLERAKDNSAAPIGVDDALIPFASQMYITRANATASARALKLISTVLSSVALVRLKCNMLPEAADVARGAFAEARALLNNKQ